VNIEINFPAPAGMLDFYHHGSEDCERFVDRIVSQTEIQVLSQVGSLGNPFSELTTLTTDFGGIIPRGVIRLTLHAHSDPIPDLEHGSPVRETFIDCVASMAESILRLRWDLAKRSLEYLRES